MFKIHKSTNGQYYVTLQGANSEVLFSSELMHNYQDARNNCEAIYHTIIQMALKTGVKNHPDPKFIKTVK